MFLGECGYDVKATHEFQTLTSPNYPQNYIQNLDCEWNIKASKGFSLQLVIKSGRTEACCDLVDVSFYQLLLWIYIYPSSMWVFD